MECPMNKCVSCLAEIKQGFYCDMCQKIWDDFAEGIRNNAVARR